MSQLLAAAGPYTLTKTWYVDGTATDVGTVTIGIVDANGDTVVSSGTATTNNGDGTYDYTLADQTEVNELTVTWTRDDTNADLTERVELVGGWVFTEAAARAFHAKADAASDLIPLASETEYTDAMIADERERITHDLEYWTNRSWVPRYCRIELAGTGSSVLSLLDGFPRTAAGYVLNRPGRYNDVLTTPISVTVGGTSKTASNYTIDPVTATIRSTVDTFTAATIANPFNVVIEYEYGLPYATDGVDRIAMKLLVDRLVPSVFTDRAFSVDNEYGNIKLTTPGMKNVSNIPEVNDWVNRHDHRVFI